MKNLSEYPTKETDNADYVASHDGTVYIDSEVCASLERRLAACREALEECDGLAEVMAFSPDGRMRTVIRETLTATAKP